MFGEVEYNPTRQFCSVSMEEQLDSLHRAVDAGKIAESSAHYPKIISVQNSYNLLCRTFDSGLAECCHHEGTSLLAYSPLAMGILSGKYFLHDRGPADARLNLFKGLSLDFPLPFTSESPSPNVIYCCFSFLGKD
uniref:NADP-dependent oxidoreductase domain-containing protein n=1 Tax=Rhizophora mucronata TaxID=61149 RepID=A0A2P2MGG3_RHIMU